ncbi:MAG: VCBS repeat-containing protein [Deltaproteobacteria bacterium]|nr:VCBS repeat-containing protein [Deltaproteobacteria bacterium]
MSWTRPGRMISLVALAAAGCGSDAAPAAGTPDAGPPTCGVNSCNESNGGGTCSVVGGQVTCACNAGYSGATCTSCASGYTANAGACLPDKCGADSCNESHQGGTCADATGHVVCTCATGYLGPQCKQCAAGTHPDQGACVKDTTTACAPATGGSPGPVAAPTLRDTLPGSWDENWLASPAVADLDHDGKMEIIAARHSVLYVYNADGTLKWQTAWANSASTSPEHGDTRMWASAVVGNFDADPELEIAVGADADSGSKSNVAVYDHKGELMPGWPAHFGGSDEVRSITAGDLDGNGTFEIVVNKTSEGPTTAVYELDGKMRAGWPQINHAICDPPAPAEACWDFGGYNQNIGVGDVDKDGFLDVISSYDAIGFGVFDRDGKPFPTEASFSDRVITSVEAYHDQALSKQGWGTGDRSEFSYSPPIIADIDANGDLEYVLVGDHEHSQSTDNKGVTFWVLNHDMTRPAGWESPKDTGMPLVNDNKGSNIVPTQPSPSVGNINADPGLEILAPAYDGNLYAFDSKGAQLWKYAFATVASPYTGASEALIADLNGDGVPEIVFATYSSGEPKKPETPAHLIILNNNGVELVKVELFARGSMAPPTIADLDGDGDLELIVSLKDSLGSGKGGVQIWDIPNSSTNCLIWQTGRGNFLRQGYVIPAK